MRIVLTTVVFLLFYLFSLTSSWRLQQNLIRRRIPKIPCRTITQLKDGESSVNQESHKQTVPAKEDGNEGSNESRMESNELSSIQNNNNTTKPVDPNEAVRKELEAKLQRELSNLEETLRSRRLALNRAKNILSESGTRGYYLVQAQVNEYLRNKATEESKVIERNKREFVVKVLPLIDKFRSIPSELPGNTKAEKAIHENYKFIRVGLELAVKKYGYVEFIPVEGDKLDSHYHQVIGLEEGEKDGLVVRCDKTGWKFSDSKDVVRKASVIVTKIPEPPKNENSEVPKEKSEEEEQQKREDDSKEEVKSEELKSSELSTEKQD